VVDLIDAERITFDAPSSGPVRLTGYRAGADDPVTCLGTISQQSERAPRRCPSC
jgi:hypothetical protein